MRPDKLSKKLFVISLLIVIFLDIPITYYNNFTANGIGEDMPLTIFFLSFGSLGFFAWILYNLGIRLIAYLLFENYLPKYTKYVFGLIAITHLLFLLRTIQLIISFS